MASDLLRYYGLNLWDVVADLIRDDPQSGWTPTRLLMLIDNLPPESALSVDLRGVEYYGWSTTNEILADLWDLTMAIAVASSKKKPPQYPRPKDLAAARKRKANRAKINMRLKSEVDAEKANEGPRSILDQLPPHVRAAHEARIRARKVGGDGQRGSGAS